MRRIGKKRMTAKIIRNAGGFTLIELLMAAMIGVFLVGGVAAIYWTQAQTYRRTDIMQELHQKARYVETLITSDLRSIGCGTNEKAEFGEEEDFGILAIKDDDWGNSSITYTADVGRQCNASNGILNSNETFHYKFYKSSMSPNPEPDDLNPNDGNTDLGRVVGVDTEDTDAVNSLLVQGVEAISFAYAFDLDKDGHLDRYDFGGHDRVLWTIDSDGDSKLDSVIDTNFDGDVNFADTTKFLTDYMPETDIETGFVRAIKVWVLIRSRHRRMELPTHLADGYLEIWHIGHRAISVSKGSNYDPLFFRTRVQFTVYMRCMGRAPG